uniref:Putative transcriptional regulator n=1 Tax=uncultured bacterium 1114 TaxID=548901 RepID=B8R934_9BACT|nr:putative transcriptional regulator [uncultured bacterium 1114]
MSLSELARELGVAPSSCFELVNTLRSSGYLYDVGGRRRTYPTRRMLENVLAITEHDPHVSRILPVIDRLRDQTRETIILGRRQGDAIIYLSVSEGPQTVRYTSEVGALKPLHSSAIGKAMLSSLVPDERKTLIGQLNLERMTPATLIDPEPLLADIEAGLARGFQVTRGENVADVMGIAMPLKVGSDLFGICIAGPLYRMAVEFLQHVPRLKTAIAELEAAF